MDISPVSDGNGINIISASLSATNRWISTFGTCNIVWPSTWKKKASCFLGTEHCDKLLAERFDLPLNVLQNGVKKQTQRAENN